MDLSDNQFTGTIPSHWNESLYMDYMDLSDNSLSYVLSPPSVHVAVQTV